MLKEFSAHKFPDAGPYVLLTYILNVCALNAFILFKKEYIFEKTRFGIDASNPRKSEASQDWFEQTYPKCDESNPGEAPYAYITG